MATKLVAFFIYLHKYNMVWLLIILNIMLIISLIVLVLYFFKSKKDNNTKNVVINNNNKYCEIEIDKHKQNNDLYFPERVFEGRFVTDDEYRQMMKNRRSDISVLMEDVNKEYEHLKELNK